MTARWAAWCRRCLRPSRIVPPALVALIVVLSCAPPQDAGIPCERASDCLGLLVCCPAPGTALPSDPASGLPRQPGACELPPCEAGAAPSSSSTSSTTSSTTSTTAPGATSSTTTSSSTTTTSTTTSTTTTISGVTILPYTFDGPFNLTLVPDFIFGGVGTDRVIVAGDAGASLIHAIDPYLAAFFLENLFNDPPPPFGRRFAAFPLVKGAVEAIVGVPNIGVRHWDPTPPPGFGFIQVVPGQSAPNGRLFGNDPTAGGAVLGGGASLNLVEYDVTQNFFAAGNALGGFPIGSTVVSGFGATATSVVLAITDGTPGHLWKHPGIANSFGPPLDIGAVGNAPRDVNVVGSVGAVPNFESDSLSIFTIDASDTVTIRTTVGVGDGPVFVNLYARTDGNVEAWTTGFNDDSAWRTIIEPDGDVVDNDTTSLAPTCDEPSEVERFILSGLASPRYFVPCHGNDRVISYAELIAP